MYKNIKKISTLIVSIALLILGLLVSLGLRTNLSIRNNRADIINSSETNTNLSSSSIVCGPLDIDNDNKLSLVDFASFSKTYGSSCSDKFSLSNGCGGVDTNNDGKVNLVDLLKFAKYYNLPSCVDKTVDSSSSSKSITINQNVLAVTYYSGHAPGNTFNYDNLITTIANNLNNASKYKGYINSNLYSNVNFNIVKRVVHNNTAKQQGVNCDQYIARVQSGQWSQSDWGSTNCWGSGTANYQQMLDENNVCNMINSGQIDEVWFFGFGNGGFWEANMTGKGAFWTNGPLVNSTVPCNKATHVMGFNYELTSDYALHSFGHRIEGVMDKYDPSDFNQFTIYNSAGNSSCGKVHFPPNGKKDYDYSDKDYITSDCISWNPAHTGVKTRINCSEWGCDQLGFMMWWMQNIPGDSSGLVSINGGTIPNWWYYITKSP